MEITPNQIRENEIDQTVYFTLTDDQEQQYQFHADIPKGVDIQRHLETNIRFYLRCIRIKEYPGADFRSFGGGDELVRIEAWIESGCKNGDQIIEKVSWKGTHPLITRIIDGEKLSEVTKAQMEKASMVKELKQVLKDIFEGRN